MPHPHRRRHGLTSDRRRALRLLASAQEGCTEAIMLAHGFSIELMVELINTGLATAKAKRMVAGGKSIEVAYVRITEAGRQALAEGDKLKRHMPTRTGGLETVKPVPWLLVGLVLRGGCQPQVQMTEAGRQALAGSTITSNQEKLT